MSPQKPGINAENPIPALSRSQVRSIDESAVNILGIPGIVLMENAARGVADHLTANCGDSTPVLLCGPGNNGGDGLALARQRAARNQSTRIVLVTGGKTLTPDTQLNLNALRHGGISVDEISDRYAPSQILSGLGQNDWIVDSLLGTGVRGIVQEPFAGWIEAVNQSNARVLSVDLPSGLDCDAGIPHGPCIRAEITVTFVAQKKGFLNPQSQAWTGLVKVEHIGIPVEWICRCILDQGDED